MNSNFLGSLLRHISNRGRALFEQPRTRPTTPDLLVTQSDALLSGRGEATGVALAAEILAGYAHLSDADKTTFLVSITEKFGPDFDRLNTVIEAFQKSPAAMTAGALHAASEPRRQELIRRLNLASGGTYQLVKMREDVLSRLSEHPSLQALDSDFVHLFSSWFNRGFLVLRRMDWSTPANILEKIIRYEAVHAIESWDHLRRRLEPADRRLYAFFHPALIDEPLIFVEVALMKDIPSSIAPLLEPSTHILAPDRMRTAVFYSISNAQPGLAGVSFGNFLIKQVVEDLKREMPQLETFVTLSPVPGFAAWVRRMLNDKDGADLKGLDKDTLSQLEAFDWSADEKRTKAIEAVLLPLAAQYFLTARDRKGRVIDPVARFHLGNGARLERLNMLGDVSPKGLAQSFGLMVNYLYDPRSIETNHEAYATRAEVITSPAIRKIMSTSAKSA